jgi:predicted ATPase
LGGNLSGAATDSSAVDVVQALLSRVPELTVLVTSRRVLGLNAEREFPLAPLPTPEGGEVPERLSLYDSVALFLDRAQQVRPDFQVTRGNAPAIAELVHRLEGIPLAIELAAARAPVLTPAQMLAQLEDRFGFLVSRRHDQSGRHRTLRAAVDWSFQLLAPELQRFFGRLCVFRDGWTTAAAEAVCEEPLALDFLALLRECSLVLSEESTGTGAMRFRMLETLREYGGELLSPKEHALLRRHHRDFFLKMAQEADGNLAGPEQALWLERLEREQENLRAALDFCLESSREAPEGAPAGLRLGAALFRFWLVRGHLSEGRRRYTALLAQPGAQEPTEARGSVLNGAGTLALEQGDYPAARSLFEESLALRRRLGDKAGLASSLNNLGALSCDHGDYPAARPLFEESLALRRELGDKGGLAQSLNNLGSVAYDHGDPSGARPLYEESVALRRELGDKAGLASSLNNLGNVARYQGDYLAARSLYGESLALRREVGHKAGVALSLHNLGITAAEQGDYPGARSLFLESLALRRELDDKGGVGASLVNLGPLLAKEEDVAGARACLAECLTLCRELPDRRFAASTLEGLARLADTQGRRERAARLYGAAQALRAVIGFPLPPITRERNERDLAKLEALLGPESYAAAFAAGQSLSFQRALDDALDDGGA